MVKALGFLSIYKSKEKKKQIFPINPEPNSTNSVFVSLKNAFFFLMVLRFLIWYGIKKRSIEFTYLYQNSA
ncbi:hypothetical protein Lal_00048066 [Lupinus albus]|nr:hypothetical protein Lal_00048066 [Lupinus albus]